MTERDKGSRIHRTAALPRLAEQGTGLHTVCAELTYNPYLLHTSVKFNGQTPRVNSLIEKYQNRLSDKEIGRKMGIKARVSELAAAGLGGADPEDLL